METQFVPYELAVKLKELGFDEDCLATYHKELHNIIPIYAKFREGDIIKAPLWQQAFDWFREKHNLESTIGTTHLIEKTFGYAIIATSPRNDSNNYVNGKRFSDYEAARTACLEKLIELITKK